MPQRSISSEQLAEIAHDLVPSFFVSHEEKLDIYRVVAMAFTIITRYCRVYDPHIKSERRCELAKDYIPILLHYLVQSGYISIATEDKLTEDYNSNPDILRILESETFLLRNLTIVRSPSKRERGCRCALL